MKKVVDLSGLLFAGAILGGAIVLSALFVTGGDLSRLLDSEYVFDNLIQIPAKKGDPRFEKKVLERMKEFGEDRKTAEKEVEEFYKHLD